MLDLADTLRVHDKVAVDANETLVVQLVHELFQSSLTRSYSTTIRRQPYGVPFGLSE
jgi:hypothetical protein